MNLRGAPNFEELLANPSRAVELPAAAARELFVRLAAVQAALTTALLATPSPEKSPQNDDRFLDAKEVGEIIGKSKSWVEKNTDALPKRRRVGGEGKWSEREIQKWMKYREFWD